MSATLATVADALIEFILSLLQDPEQAKKFNDHPEQALAENGLTGISAGDVCSVAPIIAESPHVIPVPYPVPPHGGGNTVVREIHNITESLSYIDARSTVIDQSTNQNIWAHGDVTQIFDQSAVVASGDGALAAGDGVDINNSQDHSSTINADGDANVGSTVTNTNNDGSYNSASLNSGNTDNSTNLNADDSLNNTSTDVTADHSGNSTTTDTSSSNTNVAANTVSHSSDSAAVQYNDAQQSTGDDGSSTYEDHTAAAPIDDSSADDHLLAP